MKKRFTLMMMVLCFLMSIPLKMMAETVTVHFIDKNNWSSYDAYVFDVSTNKTISEKDHPWPGMRKNYTTATVNGDKVVTWTIDLGTCTLANARIIFNNGSGGKYNQYPESGGFEVANNQYYNNNGKTVAPSEGGGSTGGGTGGGSGSTTVDWNTVNTNRLTGKKYTQGFYLAGDFFTFDTGGINYDDAVFKFQQQKSINEIAETAYDVYMVEIPASLTAKAQVMYVNENGEKTGIFGPGAADINKDTPTTGLSTEWAGITANKSTNLLDNTQNYWNFSTRNVSKSEYSDGLYEVYIAVEKNTHVPKLWKITHIADKRVAYFISNTPDATAMPLYDTYKLENRDTNTQFYNNFFGTVNFAADRSYYVISNYIHNNSTVGDAIDYGTIPHFYLERIPSPTTNKLFLQGNGGLDFTGSDPNNLICPNLAPLKVGKDYWGTRIVEYNPSRGKTDVHGTPFGFCGDLQLRPGRAVLTSVSLVGDAIPGTTNADGTWNYKSNAADMVYDETEQCYKARVVTTAKAYGEKFRFVGNHDQKITWYEDTNTDKNKMAKNPYDSESAPGHTADANDPNKVDYTEKGDPTSKDYNTWNIIWNRPAGRWTVRLYFYTYSVGTDKPVTEYYYTITANSDMELHDFVDVVYGSETNKQNITNLGRYRFMRTWSAEKAWKISDQVDIFVVSSITDDKSGVVKMTLKNINKYVSETDRVIPPKTGVILATTSEAASNIPGAKFKSREDFTSYNNLVIPMEQYDTDLPYNGDNFLEKIIYSRVIPPFKDNKYNYLFGYYNTRIATGDETCDKHKYLLGFWISKGSKPYLSNSSYLSIDTETAAKMKYLGTSYDGFVSGGSAKKVSGVIFDFDNVGGTTGINEVVNQSTKLNDGKYYTLSGQQVEKPTAGGIYIHNGRKFVVK